MSDTRRWTQPGWHPKEVQGKPVYSKKHQQRDRPMRGCDDRFCAIGPLPKHKARRKIERRDERERLDQ